MSSLKTLADAETLLSTYVPLTQKITGRDITLQRMWPLMEALGNPHERLRIVHIAGTSGKTSTAYYIAAMLEAAGKTVGLTVSPHVDSVTERVQINLQPLPAQTFVAALNEYLELLDISGLQPTYFELLVSFAYWYFDKVGVDYAVIETGMGGLHDGTNVAQNPDKLCVITDIGLDHMHVLGSTVEAIAGQKAGIIHPGNTAIMLEQDPSITQVFQDWCQQHQAELRIIAPNQQQIPDGQVLPDFQRRNWSLARQAFQFLQTRDHITAKDLTASTRAYIPGRMDTVTVQGKTLVMDGAHNEQKMQAFIQSFQKRYPNQHVPVLMSLKLGKELDAVLPLIKPITSTLILTTYKPGQDLPIPSMGVDELAAGARRFGFTQIVIEPDQDKAYERLLQEATDLAVITGSFYLVGQLRRKHSELCQTSF